MTIPSVTHTAGAVHIWYRTASFDAALTALARNLHDDGDKGPTMTALMQLGEADLLLGMEPTERAEFGVYDVHDQVVAATTACTELRDITGEPAETLTVDECERLITLLRCAVAGARRNAAEKRAGRAAA